MQTVKALMQYNSFIKNFAKHVRKFACEREIFYTREMKACDAKKEANCTVRRKVNDNGTFNENMEIA